MAEWPYSIDKRWVCESLEGTTSACAPRDFRTNTGMSESRLNTAGFGRGGSLQRGSSAPSILFEEYLADFDAEYAVTAALSDPCTDGSDGLLAWVDNLEATVGLGPNTMMQANTASSSMDSGHDQFLGSQITGFEARIRAIQETMESSTRPAENVAGTSEKQFGGGNSTMSSTLVAPDCQLIYQPGNELGEAAPHSSTWNRPTSPGLLGGNSLCGVGEVASNEGPSWLRSTSARFNVGGALEPTPILPGLIRHSSLPANPRANRGHAVHPRSIAERVRRGRISERMRKLQDLVPNMERQNNTAHMLDEVVEYVKQLQLQVQELSSTVVQLRQEASLLCD